MILARLFTVSSSFSNLSFYFAICSSFILVFAINTSTVVIAKNKIHVSICYTWPA